MMDRLKKIFNHIKGIRHIEIVIAIIAVLIMLFVYFSSNSCSASSEKTGISGSDSEYDYCAEVVRELETKLSEVDGVGEVVVLVSWKDSMGEDNGIQNSNFPIPEGVIIICDGGNNIAVKLKLIESVAAYFGISENKISVLAKNNIQN